MVRFLPIAILILFAVAGCGSGEAKIQEDTTSIRQIGAGGGSTEERIRAIQNSSIPDDVKAKKIAAIRNGG